MRRLWPKSESQDGELSSVFETEQIKSLTLALQGRLVVLAIIAVWIGTTRLPPSVYYMLTLIAVFAVIGIAQMRVVRKVGIRAWQLYAFMFVEISLLAFVIGVFTGPFTADLPVPMGFRFVNYLYFFLFVASAAFSYAPGLVLWSGVSVAISWGLVTAWVNFSYDTLGWTDVPFGGTPEEFMSVVLDPMFFGVGSRVQEIMVLMCVSGLLAIVVWRARRLVFRQARAERDRAEVTEVFGKYVPEAVAGQLIADSGAMEPQEREATVLMTDIENFTGISEPMEPADVLDMLNEYFETLGGIIAKHGGVVGQFHGDAVIAMFNVPVPMENHAAAAIAAAREIEREVNHRTFRGQTLRTRVGINTGPVVSGSVGSEGRRSYTIYGDVVNAASRIEAMNKDFGTAILVSESTTGAAGAAVRATALGKLEVRGRSEPMTIYRLDEPADQTDADQSAASS